ncbi:MAG: hypothetical protein HYV00_01135 [Deltaproteobacteria bacterium]|nr:hypothetical protein [Deltaproteobacteria bacterium]
MRTTTALIPFSQLFQIPHGLLGIIDRTRDLQNPDTVSSHEREYLDISSRQVSIEENRNEKKQNR